jgi:hypothetical protein
MGLGFRRNLECLCFQSAQVSLPCLVLRLHMFVSLGSNGQCDRGDGSEAGSAWIVGRLTSMGYIRDTSSAGRCSNDPGFLRLIHNRHENTTACDRSQRST